MSDAVGVIFSFRVVEGHPRVPPLDSLVGQRRVGHSMVICAPMRRVSVNLGFALSDAARCVLFCFVQARRKEEEARAAAVRRQQEAAMAERQRQAAEAEAAARLAEEAARKLAEQAASEAEAKVCVCVCTACPPAQQCAPLLWVVLGGGKGTSSYGTPVQRSLQGRE